jgi:hypothetical protein
MLSWDGHYWTCDASIPAWAGFRSFRTKNVGDGTISLTLASDEKTRTPPTQMQIAAYRHLRANAKRIAAAILKQVFSNYSDWQKQYADYVDPDEMPNIDSPEDLKQLIGFSGVFIHRAAKSGISYTGIQLDCSWDAEHGLGAMMHQSRIVELGGVETALLEWIADSDAER